MSWGNQWKKLHNQVLDAWNGGKINTLNKIFCIITRDICTPTSIMTKGIQADNLTEAHKEHQRPQAIHIEGRIKFQKDVKSNKYSESTGQELAKNAKEESTEATEISRCIAKVASARKANFLESIYETVKTIALGPLPRAKAPSWGSGTPWWTRALGHPQRRNLNLILQLKRPTIIQWRKALGNLTWCSTTWQ